MALEVWFKRCVRLRNVCAFAALCGATAHAATALPDRCIVADRAIGCVDERAVIELTALRKDANSVGDLVRQKLQSGQCRLFGYGERVTFVSATGSERTAVRRPGDRTIYWLPASWTQPATQCEPKASSASLLAKIGMPIPGKPAAERNDAFQAEDATAHDDSGHKSYAYRDEPADGAELPDRRSNPERPDAGYSRRDYLVDDDSTRDDYPSGPDRDGRYRPDDTYPRHAPPQQGAPLRSSTYAHNQPPGSDIDPESCTSRPGLTNEDRAACARLRR